MDLRFGEQEEQLRQEVRAFLQEQLKDRPTRGGIADDVDEEFEYAKEFNKALGRKGWMAPAWPKEYGGLGATIFEQMVFNEEFGYHRAPDTGARTQGVAMIGSTLIVHGSEEQRAKYLPKITSGEHIWCQGYSEPGAGSDLASLQTRAIRDGDEYVVNGQKIWTSGGHRSNQMFMLARSDPDAPKHRGISFLIIDDIQNTPGLTVRPLINMANRHSFNEVFFEDVRVPAANRVGEENRGWYVGMTLLDFERSGISGVAGTKRTLEEYAGYLRTADEAKRRQARPALADLFIANEVGRWLGYRIGHIQTNGGIPNYEASAGKMYTSELSQRVSWFAVNMLGLAGQLLPEDPHAPLRGTAPESYMGTIPSTIAGGTSEVQRNIIATRGLGLPRA